ncbi:unnamed protein product, partial [Mesorhabditis spiculigera]
MPTEVQDLTHFRGLLSQAGASKLVVCDFYADWCGPCRMIAPFFEQLSNHFTNALFCKINVDRARDVMQTYQVRAMPTFVFFKNGAEVDRLQGANPNSLQDTITRHYSDAPRNPLAASSEEIAFLKQYENTSKRMDFYKDPINRTLALSLIPTERLANEAMVDGKVNRFLLLKNLTEWFKGEFFTWTDTPTCHCGEKTSRESYTNGTPSDDDLSGGANRVEVYTCKCGQAVRFPRYNDPVRLLETRTGRCGEWANCFTLCAASMDFDIRYVHDVTDHVWCEVWIPELERWVHVDPCENLVDAPLVYEIGWKKKLSYVIAFGLDHACDVTWRYVLDDRKAVRLRRSVREEVLLNFLTKLTNRMLKDSTAERKEEVKKRRLIELAEMLHIKPRKASDFVDYSGRISGDEQWRKDRGETGTCSTTGSPKRKQIVIRPNDQELAAKKFSLEYNVVRDVYTRGDTVSKGFHSLVFKAKDVQLKKELDWKMAYLCRKEGKDEAEITWAIDLTGLTSKKATLKIDGIKTYENGRLNVTVCADDICMRVPPSGEFSIDNPPSAVLNIKAHFIGGQGSNAFQHAQLFRTSFDSQSPQMTIEIEFS